MTLLSFTTAMPTRSPRLAATSAFARVAAKWSSNPTGQYRPFAGGTALIA
jgi:hypothetical protein